MTDREKLVSLLGVINASAYIRTNTEAGFSVSKYGEGFIADYLVAHGVTIKEPNRVFTLEEVFTAIKEDRQLYVEDIEDPTNTGWDDCNCVDYWLNKGINKYEMREDYGKTWRCWAEKPTEEERKAALWE
jgi:hypothetical protein